MASYNAAINIVVSGQQRLDYVLNSVERLNAITAKLKPINLLAPGAGAGGDAIRAAKKQLDDFARAVINFQPQGIQKRAKELSNTIAGAADQAAALTTALANVGLKSGGFKEQAAEVKNYALALDTAARNAARLNVINQAVQRGARVENIATRFNVSPEQVEQRLANIREAAAKRKAQLDDAQKQRDVQRLLFLKREEDFERRLADIRERNNAAEKQRAKTKEALSSGLIGGAFPLLFGQGPGAAIGGGVGGFAGGLAGGQLGFGLSLVGTAIGASFDAVIQSSVDLVKSLRQGGDAATYLENTFGSLDPTLKKQIQNLQNSGQTAAAAELAFQELARTVGADGAKAFLDLGKSTEAGTNSLKRITASFVAAGLAANKYFNDIKFGKDKDITDFLPPQFRPTPTPVEADQTAAFKQQTTELSKNNDILRIQVQLTSVSAKNDLDKLTTLQKQIVNKEYENELTKISIQLKNKEINIEQNKLLITAANLNLSKKLGDIERTRTEELTRRQQETARANEEAARATEQRTKAILGINRDYLTDQLKAVDLNTKQIELFKGTEAALENQLNLTQTVGRIRTDILENERELALIEAKKSGLTDAVLKQYELKSKILQAELNIEFAITQQKIAQSKLEKQLRLDELQRSKEEAVRGIKVQQDKVQLDIAAFTEDPRAIEVARQNLDQINRAYEAELPILKEIDTLQRQIQSGAYDETAIAFKNQEIALQQSKLSAIREELTLLDSLEQRQLRLQQFFATYGALIQSVSGEIANAVTFGVAELVRGTKSAEQVFSEFLNAIGSALIQAAQQMIATYIAIGIAKIFAGLGGNGGSGNAATALGSNPNVAAYAPLAKGGMFGNGVAAFANGGTFTNSIVSSPTLFKFADGGTTKTGLMGEAGPEAIMPLKRGANGKLGVEADLSGAMQRYRQAPGSAGAGYGGGGGAAASGPIVVEVRASMERINSVDYVTADQFQAGIQQAAQQGAAQGERRTLQRLQQSPSTRRRVGVG